MTAIPICVHSMSADPLELLRAAITASGLSTSVYARTVLIRDPRTVRRWLSGESPIPQSVLDYLSNLAKTSSTEQT